MSLCLGAPRQNVFLLQLFLAGSVAQLDVQGVSSADLAGQRAWNRDVTAAGVSILISADNNGPAETSSWIPPMCCEVLEMNSSK